MDQRPVAGLSDGLISATRHLRLLPEAVQNIYRPFKLRDVHYPVSTARFPDSDFPGTGAHDIEGSPVIRFQAGHAPCQLLLGFAYANGQGVPQDYLLAHLWYNLAAIGGGADAAIARDIVAGKMTPTQIAEAQKFARDWKPKKSPVNSWIGRTWLGVAVAK